MNARYRFYLLLMFAPLFCNNLLMGDEYLRFENGSTDSHLPGQFIYDPLTQKSLPNRRSWQVTDAPQTISTSLKSSQSFSVEAFAQPQTDINMQPGSFQTVFQSSVGNSLFQAGIYRSKPPHSYHWLQARLLEQKQKPIELAKNLYAGLTMVKGETPWRHIAFVWQADARIARFYLDYQLLAEHQYEAAPDWNLQEILVGGSAESDLFNGSIDEVRITGRDLQPWEFLRSTDVELTGVSYAPETNPSWPADYGHVDVRLHYGAIGDGIHDDTAAIRRAFMENQNRVPIEYQTVYFPPGTYLISDTIQFTRFMICRGAGADKTVIQLKDQAAGYDQPEVPKPAFAVGYDWPYVNRSKRQQAGNVIGNYLFDLTIDTGKGNPAALGLDFHCNNLGCVENVSIRAGDGSGLVGLDLKRGWPGPCLIKNVNIEGFDVGIAAAHREYSLVFSGVHLSGQKKTVIENNGNILSLENLRSDNTVPAIVNQNGGMIVLINSQLIGSQVDQPAIQSQNGSLYLRNVAVEGYPTALVETVASKDKPEEEITRLQNRWIEEYYTGGGYSVFEQKERGSLKLEIKQTPAVNFPPVNAWVNIQKYASLVDRGDWSIAIQTAIDAGAELIYFPDSMNYRIDQDVILRGSIRTFLGGSPKMKLQNHQPEQPELGGALVTDRKLPEFQSILLNVAHVRHVSATDLVFRHCQAEQITAAAGCGDLFLEDTGGKFRFSQHQRVWARQLNPETKGIPEVINRGGQLWILGMKTEYLSTKIENYDGARTELLGGLMYPVHPVTDEMLPMFLNVDSDISLVHGVSVYNKNHKIYMKETQQGITRDYTDWHWISGRPLMPLYRGTR